MTNTSKLPYRSEANATDFPSWLHTGANSYDSLSVSGIALPPAAGTDQMSPLYAKSRVWPSGEMAGYRSHRGGFSAPAGARHANTMRGIGMANLMALLTYTAGREREHPDCATGLTDIVAEGTLVRRPVISRHVAWPIFPLAYLGGQISAPSK